jgi:cell division protein FtsZ
MGIGRAKGENRVIESVRQAVSSPLLETTIEGAKSVILNVTGGKDLMLTEVNEAAVLVQGIIDSSANIIFGATIDENISDEVKITVIATGFSPLEPETKEKVVEIKPAIIPEPIVKPVVTDTSVPPLLREMEEQARRAQAQAVDKQPEVEEEKPEPAPIFVDREPKEQPVQEEKKGKELPAFMRKLFKK